MNEEKIWKFIYEKTHNAYGTAALMGNLMAESSLNPRCVTGSRDADYIQKADAGTIDFVHDSKAFGLVQWCFRTRKEGLLNYARSSGSSVGDIDVQLNYMWEELKNSYKTAYSAIMNAADIRTASDIVMLKYEKPANTSDTMKQRRANYGQKYFDMFASSKPSEDSEKKDPISPVKRVIVTTDKVNLRAGNGLNFPQISRVNRNASYEWVATAANGWHAIRLPDRVAWVSGEFSKVQ